jgi:(2Fe-2S) ferredoxin
MFAIVVSIKCKERTQISLSRTAILSTSKVILVCQNRTCRRQGSAKVLAAFQAYKKIADFTVEPTGCLGKCGNGPMVVVLPEQTWYSHVDPESIPKLSQEWV